MKLEFFHADTCLPDYWSGHHRPYVQIAVYPRMTLKAIKDAIRDELRQGCVSGSGDDACLLCADFIQPEEEKRADQLTRAAYAAVNRMKPAKKGQRTFFRDIEPQEEGDDPVYAYFVLMEV